MSRSRSQSVNNNKKVTKLKPALGIASVSENQFYDQSHVARANEVTTPGGTIVANYSLLNHPEDYLKRYPSFSTVSSINEVSNEPRILLNRFGRNTRRVREYNKKRGKTKSLDRVPNVKLPIPKRSQSVNRRKFNRDPKIGLNKDIAFRTRIVNNFEHSRVLHPWNRTPRDPLTDHQARIVHYNLFDGGGPEGRKDDIDEENWGPGLEPRPKWPKYKNPIMRQNAQNEE